MASCFAALAIALTVVQVLHLIAARPVKANAVELNKAEKPKMARRKKK
jgi:hypothetical protein